MTSTDRAPPEPPYVLLVEDDALTQQIIVEVLREEGCTVAATPFGEEALDLAARRAPCVIVLDHRLADMDGSEFIRRYRATPPPHAPVVLITAEYRPEAIADEIGAAGVLPKPFDIVDLASTLRPYLQRGTL